MTNKNYTLIVLLIAFALTVHNSNSTPCALDDGFFGIDEPVSNNCGNLCTREEFFFDNEACIKTAKYLEAKEALDLFEQNKIEEFRKFIRGDRLKGFITKLIQIAVDREFKHLNRLILELAPFLKIDC